jgi:hypothetical protein
MFRKKTPTEVMQGEMQRLAPVLFPGGHEQIKLAGKSIAAMLDNRISAEGAARIYASTKYLAHTAADKSKARVVQYILRQGLGKLSPADAGAIYDRFISEPANTTAPAKAEPGTLFINADLADREYTLDGASQSTRIGAALFTALLLGLRSSGWRGAADLFDASGTMMKPLEGTYSISERDAREIAKLLSDLTASQPSDIQAAVSPLLVIASQGAFTLKA